MNSIHSFRLFLALASVMIPSCMTAPPGLVAAKKVGIAVDPGLSRATKVHLGTTVFTNSTSPLALVGYNPAGEFAAAVKPGVQVSAISYVQESKRQIPAHPEFDVVVVLRPRGATGGSGYYNAAAGVYMPTSYASPGGPVFRTESFLGMESDGMADVGINYAVFEGASGKRIGTGGGSGTAPANGGSPSIAMNQALREAVKAAAKGMGLLNPQMKTKGFGVFEVDFGAPKSMTSTAKHDTSTESKEGTAFEVQNPFDPNRKKSKIEQGLDDLQKKTWEASKKSFERVLKPR